MGAGVERERNMSETSDQIQQLSMQIYELTQQLHELQRAHTGDEVPNYEFATQQGTATLLDLFAGRDRLLVIHNMGQACRYCTLWGDGFNGQLGHLENVMSVVLVSKNTPEEQRRFANERGWRFRLASHGGGDYIKEQTVMEGQENMPGAVVYERQGDVIRRKNAVIFGYGDMFCSAWNLLALAGVSPDDWHPQFNYWQRPDQLDDGGAQLPD